MARRAPKNPINDIVGEVGGWLGGGARALNTAFFPEKNPALNRQTRNAITLSQQVGDIVSGGAVSAIRTGNPDAVQRYAAMTAATYAAGMAAGPALGALAKGASKGYKVAKGTKAAKAVTRELSHMKRDVARRLPVSPKKVDEIRRRHIDQLKVITTQMNDRYVQQQAKTAQMANRFMQQYHEYNPVYSRAEAMHIEDVARQLQQANAPAMEINIDPVGVSRNLNKSANEIFQETIRRAAQDPKYQYPGWQEDIAQQLKKDIEQAQAYQRARGVLHRVGIETTRRLPTKTIEQKLQAEFRHEDLMDRLEVQLLRSAVRRGSPPPRR